MTTENEPTTAEWKVLRAVWEARSCSAAQVITQLSPSSDWSPSTVKTLLHRLVEKGHLKTTKRGNSFVYSAARSPLRSLRRAGETLLERASKATVGPLLAHLVKQSDLSDEDLRRLRGLINERLPGTSTPGNPAAPPAENTSAEEPLSREDSHDH